jgi:hypothetical protein
MISVAKHQVSCAWSSHFYGLNIGEDHHGFFQDISLKYPSWHIHIIVGECWSKFDCCLVHSHSWHHQLMQICLRQGLPLADLLKDLLQLQVVSRSCNTLPIIVAFSIQWHVFPTNNMFMCFYSWKKQQTYKQHDCLINDPNIQTEPLYELWNVEVPTKGRMLSIKTSGTFLSPSGTWWTS